MQRNGTIASFDDRVAALKRSMRDIVDFGSDRAEAIRDKLVDVKDTAVDGASTAMNRTGQLIKKHPIVAVGFAFGIGYLAMKLLRR